MPDVVEYRTFSWPRLALAVLFLAGAIALGVYVHAHSAGVGWLTLAAFGFAGVHLVLAATLGRAAVGNGLILERLGGFRLRHLVRTIDLAEVWVHTREVEGAPVKSLRLRDRYGNTLTFSAEGFGRRESWAWLRGALAREVLGSPAAITDEARALLANWRERTPAT